MIIKSGEISDDFTDLIILKTDLIFATGFSFNIGFVIYYIHINLNKI